eukprot:6729506-Prymnesium_polylepis.1
MIVTSVTDLLKAFPPEIFWRRHVLAHFAYSEARLAKLYRGTPMHLSQLYADTVKKVALGLIYGPVFPPAYLVTSLSLFNSYLCTRAGIRYWYKRPATVDFEMMMSMRTVSYYTAFSPPSPHEPLGTIVLPSLTTRASRHH